MGQRILRFAVTAGLAVGALLTASLATASGRTDSGAATQEAWHFVSAPNLRPPRVLLLSHKHGAISNGLFLGDNLPALAHSRPVAGEASVMLLDSAMRPVWVQGVGLHGANDNLQQETYQGHPVLSWWEGGQAPNGIGIRIPKVIVVDERYRRIATIQAALPWLVDGHDYAIVGNSIWLAVGRYLHDQNESAYGGSTHGTLYDCGIQEYDLRTGKLLYTWDALNPGGQPHVPLSQSEVPPPPSNAGPSSYWNPYHLNSLQVLPHHRLLISMRDTSAVYLIDTATSKTVWTLGGKASTFSQGPDADFAWQHDARLVSNGAGADAELTLFNDNCCQDNTPAGSQQSKGMIITINPRTHTTTLVAAYRHRPPLLTDALGSMQLLGGGNVLIDWSHYVSEYSSSGQQLLDARWPGLDKSYRVTYTDTWVGIPYYPPAGAVRQVHGKAVVYASWNGATQVASWAVLAGSSKRTLQRVSTHARTGFETHMTLTRPYHLYEVQALGAQGRVLRTSRPFSHG